MRNVTRWLAKVSEHTQGAQNEQWTPGVSGLPAHAHGGGDVSHWSNEQVRISYCAHSSLHTNLKSGPSSFAPFTLRPKISGNPASSRGWRRGCSQSWPWTRSPRVPLSVSLSVYLCAYLFVARSPPPLTSSYPAGSAWAADVRERLAMLLPTVPPSLVGLKSIPVPRAGGSPTTLACGEMRLAIDSSGTMFKTHGSRFTLILAY